MRPITFTLATLAVALAAGSAGAVSSTSSAVSESLATSVGSVSDSFRGSSHSSRPGPPRLAAGEFRVVEVAAADRAGRLVLTLEPADSHNSDSFALELPERALAPVPLQAGDRVAATPRPFGVEFARLQGVAGDAREPRSERSAGSPALGAPATARQVFFLVLHDDWYRELSARPLTL
jgi:hypothetical protein